MHEWRYFALAGLREPILASGNRGVIMDIVGTVGTWFGYVGACVVSPDVTCRPFLAFVALGAAAATALTLMLLAYRAALTKEIAATDERQLQAHAREVQERVRRTVADKAAMRPALHARLRAAA